MKKYLMAGLLFCMALSVQANTGIEIVLPSPAGGAVDFNARVMSTALTQAGYENRVVHKTGGNSEIARQYTLEKNQTAVMFGSNASFILAALADNRDNPYLNNFVFVGPTVGSGVAFAVPESSAVRAFNDLIKLAQNPRVPLPCAVSNQHGNVLLLWLNQNHGTNFLPVQYRGAAQSRTDLVGGHIGCTLDTPSNLIPIEDRLTLLAIHGKSHRPSFRSLPAISERFPGFQFENWFAIAIPKNSPLLKDKRLMNVFATWQHHPDSIKLLMNMDMYDMRVEDLTPRIEGEIRRFGSASKPR